MLWATLGQNHFWQDLCIGNNYYLELWQVVSVGNSQITSVKALLSRNLTVSPMTGDPIQLKLLSRSCSDRPLREHIGGKHIGTFTTDSTTILAASWIEKLPRMQICPHAAKGKVWWRAITFVSLVHKFSETLNQNLVSLMTMKISFHAYLRFCW